ncbi:MAG: carbohydrate ABC transporter permease [Victivallales bacterium]|nr:carbohydrate ABC transporter permease [Victivallales bacterium]
MSIISEIGRKSPKVKFFMFGMYALLITGAVSMVYPFAIMVSGTSKSGVDSPDAELIPRFLVHKTDFYRKSVEAFFNEDLEAMRMAYDLSDENFRTMFPPESVNSKLVEVWNDFESNVDLPFYSYELAFCGYKTSRNIQPWMLRRFKNELKQEYGSIGNLNQAMRTDFVSWNSVFVRPRLYLQRRFSPGAAPYSMKWIEFKQRQEHKYRIYVDPDSFFRSVFLKTLYPEGINFYNRTHGTSYASWSEIILPYRYPGKQYTDKEREDWNIFVRSILNLYCIRVDKAALPLYREYLKARYYGKIAGLNSLYNTSYKSFDEIPLVEEVPLGGVIISDWSSLIQGWTHPKTGKQYIIPAEMLYIKSVPGMFREYVIARYGSLDAANAALGTNCKNIQQLNIPARARDYIYFSENSGSLKWEFLSRNFIAVFEYIFLQGSAIVNTVIYCLLAIACALIINPLGAYALSRYKPRYAYKVLLFLMLTMAFPPMVTSIPVFLMLREFNLLNTFAALILPGAANGYSIFLLKGFFDSLPQELYESAELDGAGEFRIFWQITMSLSKPILAVIALQAFNTAYANFMMALLICQDQNMWTLMPWLYQLQQSSCQGITFASLLVAAVPTFIIFVFCQNIIMRGIVVPVEK